MGKLVLDLHDIFRNGKEISQELGRVIDEAVEKGIPEVEIIPGRGSGQLKRRVLRFLDQPHIKAKYHRLKVDPLNHGRLFVYFKKK
jgi:dsDNA-specific endonuclease/ATPase MutS2